MPYPGLLHPEPLPLWQSTADPCLHRRHPNTQSQVWLSLCGVSWCTQGFVCALQESVFPVLCKSWPLYGGVNSQLLQEGLCHLQVCCTQSPCPCGRPLLTCASTGDTQTLKGRADSPSVGSPGAHKGLSPLTVSGGYKV